MKTFHIISVIALVVNITMLVYGFFDLNADMVIYSFVCLPATMAAALWSSDFFNGKGGRFYDGYWPF